MMNKYIQSLIGSILLVSGGYAIGRYQSNQEQNRRFALLGEQINVNTTLLSMLMRSQPGVTSFSPHTSPKPTEPPKKTEPESFGYRARLAGK